ncbi:uncharacterized protein [Palaemon carinicauda]|uniref:uncharacterized protein n=1 Tax=Palaemon carinicauda TaxID=392227 RepID=UPI0035B5AD79
MEYKTRKRERTYSLTLFIEFQILIFIVMVDFSVGQYLNDMNVPVLQKSSGVGLSGQATLPLIFKRSAPFYPEGIVRNEYHNISQLGLRLSPLLKDMIAHVNEGNALTETEPKSRTDSVSGLFPDSSLETQSEPGPEPGIGSDTQLNTKLKSGNGQPSKSTLDFVSKPEIDLGPKPVARLLSTYSVSLSRFKAEPKLVSEALSETERRAEPAEVDPDEEPEANPEIVLKSEPEFELEAEPEVVPEYGPEFEQGEKPNVVPEFEVSTRPEFVLEFGPEVFPESEPEFHPVVSESTPENKADFIPEFGPEASESEPEPDPGAGPEFEPEVLSESESEIKSEVVPESKPDARPEIAESEPEFKSGAKHEIVLEFELEIFTESEPEIEQEVVPEPELEAGPKFKPYTVDLPEPESHLAYGSKQKTGVTDETKPETQIESELGVNYELQLKPGSLYHEEPPPASKRPHEPQFQLEYESLSEFTEETTPEFVQQSEASEVNPDSVPQLGGKISLELSSKSPQLATESRVDFEFEINHPYEKRPYSEPVVKTTPEFLLQNQLEFIGGNELNLKYSIISTSTPASQVMLQSDSGADGNIHLETENAEELYFNTTSMLPQKINAETELSSSPLQHSEFEDFQSKPLSQNLTLPTSELDPLTKQVNHSESELGSLSENITVSILGQEYEGKGESDKNQARLPGTESTVNHKADPEGILHMLSEADDNANSSMATSQTVSGSDIESKRNQNSKPQHKDAAEVTSVNISRLSTSDDDQNSDGVFVGPAANTTGIYGNMTPNTNSSDEESTELGSIKWSSSRIILFIIQFVIMIETVLGNLMVILSVKVEKKLQTPFNYYIVNLAFTDMNVGFSVMSLFMIYNLYDYFPFNNFLCNYWIWSDYTMTFESVMTLAAISLDRLWSVTWSLHYRNHNSGKKSLLIILGTWVWVAVIWLPPFFYDRAVHEYGPGICYWDTVLNKNLVVWVGFMGYYFPLFLMIGAYARIMWVVKKRASTIRDAAKKDSITSQPTETSVSCETGPNEQKKLVSAGPSTAAVDERQEAKLKREMKAVYTLLNIVVIFLICWVPFYILFVLSAWFPTLFPDWYITFSYWMAYINSAVNPILYPLSSLEFRAAYKKVFNIVLCRGK